MKLLAQILFFALLSATVPARADIIILHDGVSYSGRFTPPANGKLSFTDNQGIGYQFPVSDIQSLVFSNAADNITLHNGKTYSGQLNGEDVISFEGSGGIDYQFPCAMSALSYSPVRKARLLHAIFPRWSSPKARTSSYSP